MHRKVSLVEQVASVSILPRLPEAVGGDAVEGETRPALWSSPRLGKGDILNHPIINAGDRLLANCFCRDCGGI